MITDINRGWGNVRENVYITAKEHLGCYRWKLHKSGLDGKCSKFVH
jgi:hypothetical protein